VNTPSHFFLSENNIPFKDYLKFGLSVDCVVFGYNERKVQVLLIERNAEPFKGSWALPGELVPMNANLEDSANDVLKNLTGLSNIFMEQFFTFGSVDRHPAGRVATVVYYSLV
jgi:8-oxo-dGTP diphosphatase